MAVWSRMQKTLTAITTAGALSGIGFYIFVKRNHGQFVQNSWTTNTTVSPSAKWDFNWDHREPTSLVKPLPENATESQENKYNELIEKNKSKCDRNIILIRHGQYNLKGAKDVDRYLTDLGRKQAATTGERLKTLNIPWDKMIRSTFTRAQETAKIIAESLPDSLHIENCQMIVEGAPIPPDPPVTLWVPEPSEFYRDGARIEAAFRKYFHRADPKQEKPSYELIVCHANVIRYFVCRALQLPPEAWLRMSLNHASITWLTVRPSGSVILRQLGDSGHMPPAYVTQS